MTADSETERREPVRIHLLWQGPHTFEDVFQLDGGADFGIYQVYGPHPVSGTDSLLYIGQANAQTFGARFANPDRQPWSPDDEPWGDNTALLRFFVGRVHPTQCQRDRGAIDDELWGTYIDTAEKLLICAHTGTNRASPGSLMNRQMSTTTAMSSTGEPAYRCCRRSPACATLGQSSSQSVTTRSNGPQAKPDEDGQPKPEPTPTARP